MSINRSLIAPSANPRLQQALHDKLLRRAGTTGSLGELEPLAVRLGLIQSTLRPRFRQPAMVLFAADHGLAVDGLPQQAQFSTSHLVQALLAQQLPVTVFARTLGLELSVVDAGVSDALAPHPRLLARKIAHGTRNARVGAAMSLDQAHAAIRAGMEIGETLTGNVVACAGLGEGAHESAALVLSRLSGSPLQDFIVSGPDMRPEDLQHVLLVLEAAIARHRDVSEPVETLAAFGGFEIAMMVGLMLVAAGKRHLIIVDGVPACAALAVAARLAPSVTDYCLYCRSHAHAGLDGALRVFQASALLELGLQSTDGTGAALAWPLLRSAAALLTEVADGEDPGPSHPAGITTLSDALAPAGATSTPPKSTT